MRFNIEIKGTRPIIIQSDRLADPMNKIAQELRRVAKGKDKTTDAEQAKIAEIEWYGALYVDDDNAPQIAIPGDNLLRALRDAAAGEKRGESVRREVMIEDDLIPIQHDGPKDLAKMYADDRFVFRKTVVIQKRRTPRTRPRLPVWGLSFTARIDGAQTLTGTDLRRFLERAGTVGIGTWRPRYGHFHVTRFETAKD